MIIASTADIHSPQYYQEFLSALERMEKKPDLFLLAGDMVDNGSVLEMEKVVNALFGKVDCPVVACFGNNEYQEIREEMKRRFREIIFLDDSYVVLKIRGEDVGIVGSTGSLDSPTSWQVRNIPNIREIYRERISKVDGLLEKISNASFRILLIHYSPTYRTLEGEPRRTYPFLGSRKMEEVLWKREPSLVVHGHSHKGKRFAWVGRVPVYNVALPVNKEIVLIDTSTLKPGLQRFL